MTVCCHNVSRQGLNWPGACRRLRLQCTSPHSIVSGRQHCHIHLQSSLQLATSSKSFNNTLYLSAKTFPLPPPFWDLAVCTAIISLRISNKQILSPFQTSLYSLPDKNFSICPRSIFCSNYERNPLLIGNHGDNAVSLHLTPTQGYFQHNFTFS